MSRRKKKGEPEMLIVSFCDIVTITTAAMFFAMLITIQEAVKIPVFRPTPRSKVIDKAPVFFECREKMLFYVDMEGLSTQVQKLLSSLPPNVRSGDISQFLKVVQGNEVTNEYYKVLPAYLLTTVLAVQAQPGTRGDSEQQLEMANSKFQSYLRSLDSKKQYVVFLVRDDSFGLFRHGRKVAGELGFDIGWELLGADEPIKFGAGGAQIPSQ